MMRELGNLELWVDPDGRWYVPRPTVNTYRADVVYVVTLCGSEDSVAECQMVGTYCTPEAANVRVMTLFYSLHFESTWDDGLLRDLVREEESSRGGSWWVDEDKLLSLGYSSARGGWDSRFRVCAVKQQVSASGLEEVERTSITSGRGRWSIWLDGW
ncbi:hypothetical protein F5Y11DRAFT_331881 [Daldinia sp. FL1419]|nr:hypothetical protein F5Y11DRAFT_331881 [Daldinia sp. FL1419]